MEMPKETRDRIFAAANKLYEQAERVSFPTVDAVRKVAKVNMNDASTGMKDWRHLQTAQAAPVASQVPETIQQAGSASLSVLWQKAQELANESLRTAQAGWDAERLEAEILNKQLGDAYDEQALVLESRNTVFDELTTAFNLLTLEKNLVAEKLTEVSQALTLARASAERAEARAIEIERRATELRKELDHAHSEATVLRNELVDVRKANVSETDALRRAQTVMQGKLDDAAEKAAAVIEVLRSDLAMAKAKAEAVENAYQAYRKQSDGDLTAAHLKLDKTQQNEAKAREDAAALRGQLDTLKEQNSHILNGMKKSLEKPGEMQANKGKNG